MIYANLFTRILSSFSNVCSIAWPTTFVRIPKNDTSTYARPITTISSTTHETISLNNGRLNFLLCLLKLRPARLLDILHLLLTDILLRNFNYILFSCLLQAVTLKTKKTILIRLLAENGLFRVKILFYKLFNLSSFSDTVS